MPCPSRGPKTRTLSFHVVAPSAVALLAGDAENVAGCVVPVGGRLGGLRRIEVGSVALQTAGRDGPVHAGDALVVARADDPVIELRPVRHRQLEEPVALPV
jgi:hypothetical protein